MPQQPDLKPPLKPLARRQFLRRGLLAGLTVAAASGMNLLQACSAPPAQSPSAGAAPTPAPTQANPFAAATTSAPAPTAAPAIASGGGGKMTYWGGLIFSDAANNLFVKTIQDWGKQNNLDISARIRCLIEFLQDAADLLIAASGSMRQIGNGFRNLTP